MKIRWAGAFVRLRFGLIYTMLSLSAAAQAQPSVRWEPEYRFQETMFPAFAIAAAGKDAKGATQTAQGYGYWGSAELGVRVLQAPPGMRFKVEVEVPEIGASGEIEAPVQPSDGKDKIILPRLSFSQARFASIAQPLTTEATFRLYADGSLVGEQRRPVRVRAITDAPLQACLTPQKCTNYSYVFAAFVNEDHPAIDTLLRKALDIPAIPVKSWVGTQRGQEEVLRQAWAIWYLLQRNRVTYSSITTVADTRQDVFSQNVRPFSQVLLTRQANCIDGTVFLASLLRKIGIEPIIALVPGHAFLGFYTDPQRTKPVFLETTMLNDANNPFHNQAPTKAGRALANALGMDIHMQQSWQSFLNAINVGGQRYAQAAPNLGKPGYSLVPVFKAREAGILPLPL